MKIGKLGTRVLTLKNLTHSNGKNPGFKPRLGTWMPSLIFALEGIINNPLLQKIICFRAQLLLFYMISQARNKCGFFKLSHIFAPSWTRLALETSFGWFLLLDLFGTKVIIVFSHCIKRNRRKSDAKKKRRKLHYYIKAPVAKYKISIHVLTEGQFFFREIQEWFNFMKNYFVKTIIIV